MQFSEIIANIPVLKDIQTGQQIRKREGELAIELFDKWVVQEEISYDDTERLLAEAAEVEGIDPDRTFHKLSTYITGLSES